VQKYGDRWRVRATCRVDVELEHVGRWRHEHLSPLLADVGSQRHVTSGLGGRRFFEHEVGRTRNRRVDGRAGRFWPDAVEYSVIPRSHQVRGFPYMYQLERLVVVKEPRGRRYRHDVEKWLILVSSGLTRSEIFAVPVGTVMTVRSTVAPGG